MKKKIILIIILIIAVITGIIFGLSFRNSSKKALSKDINIYFLNENTSSIVPEARTINYDDDSELLDLVLDNIIKGPQGTKNKPITEKNTKVLSTVYNQSTLTVDFSKEFLRDDTTGNMLSAYAVIRTLCQLEKITGVMVTVEGQPIRAADGSLIGFLTNNDIDLESDRHTTDSKDIILYFADKDGNLVKEVRTIKITDTRPIESYIIKELIKGPVNKNLLPTLTSDTELISAETAKNTCHVTFKNFIDKNLSNPSSKESMLAVYSVVNSLTELDTVNSVRFLFEGKTEEMVGPFDFSGEIKKNKDIIK